MATDQKHIRASDVFLTLSHSNVSPCLEHHHGDRTSWKGVPNDKFSDDIQADLLIGDGLNHSNGDSVYES